MRRQVLTLPEVLQLNPVEAVIFTARKAICVADSLRRLGIWVPQGYYTSTRALTDASWIDGRSFLLVEDVASSGRTIRRKVSELRAGGASDVKCFAMSIEGPKEQWEESIDAPLLGPIVYSKREESLLHARSLITAFQKLPRPYNIDWPVFELQRPMAIGQLRESGWAINRQGFGEDAPFNVEFSDATYGRVVRSLPAWARKVAKNLQFAKVRVYPVSDPQPGGTVQFLVPIAALGEVGLADIEEILTDLDREFGTSLSGTLGWQSAYRAAQYLLSQLLGHAVLADEGRSPRPAPDHEALTYLFGPGPIDQVGAASARLKAWADTNIEKYVSVVRSASVTTCVDRFSQVIARDTERAFADGVLTSFFMAQFASSQEGRLRRKLGEELNIARRSEIVDELAAMEPDAALAGDASLDFAELRHHLHREMVVAKWEPSDSTRQLVSDFLDRAVDAGEVVPEERLVGSAISRRFRAGEILEFQREMQALAEVVLRTYQERTDSHSLGSDSIQKLISGFFRYLISKDIFSDKRGALSSVDRADDIQMRFHIRGVVVSSVDMDFVSDSEIQSFATLESAGVLAQSDDPDTPGYVLPSQPALEPPDNLASDAEDYGEAMAHLLRMRDPGREQRRLVAADDFARLVTLVNPTDQCLAPGADICIAMNLMRSRTRNSGSAIARSDEYEAVNQGLAKVTWTLDEVGRKLLDRIESSLTGGEQGPLSMRKWRSVLSALRPTAPDSLSTGLVRAEARWLADAFIYLTARRVVLSDQDVATEAAREALANRAYHKVRDRGVKQLQSRSDAVRDLEAALAALADDGPESSRLADVRAVLPAAWEHLESAAGDVLADCYSLDLKSRGVAATKRSFKSYLLALSKSGWSDEAHWQDLSIAGVSRGIFKTGGSQTGLTGLRAVVPLNQNYDGETVAQVCKFCDETDPDAALVLVEDVPKGLRPFLEGEEHAIVLPDSAVQLVERSQRVYDGSFVRLMHNGASTQIRGGTLSAEVHGVFDALALTWSVSEVSPTPAQGSLPGLGDNSVTINLTQSEVTVNAGDNFHFDRSQVGTAGSGSRADGNVFAQQNEAALVAELGSLLESLEVRAAASPPLSGDAQVVREAIEASASGDGAGVLAKLGKLSRGALETAREIGVEVAAAAIVKASGME